MGCYMDRGGGWYGGGHGGGGGTWSTMPVVPAPMVGLGMLVGVMFGLLFGMMLGKKHAMMRGRHGAGRWHKSMMHHHHGFGTPGCCSEHGAGTEAESDAMRGAEGGPVPDIGSGI